MSKLVLNDVNLELGAEAATAALNANWAAIEAFADSVLSRANVPPNQMQADLDMNGFGIINVIQAVGDGVIRKVSDGTPANDQLLIKDLRFSGATVSAGASREALITINPAAAQVSYSVGSTGLPANVQDAITSLDTAADAAGTLASTANGTANTALANAATAQATANAALTANPVAPVVTESGTSRTATAGQAGDYTRFTNASAKTYTFDAGSNTYVANKEYHVRNVGAGTLTLVGAGGMTLNPPAGGSLVIPQNTTATVKILSGTTADVIGGGAAGGGGADARFNVDVDAHPASPTIFDDEFEAISFDAKWSWYNQSTSTANLVQGSAVLVIPASGSPAVRGFVQNPPSGSWTMRMKLQTDFTQSNFARAGLGVIRTASNKILMIGNAYASGSKTESNSWNQTSFIGAIGTGSVATQGTSWDTYFFEVSYDGSSVYTFRYSRNGYVFTSMGTEAQATNLGGAADKVGIVMISENSQPVTAIVDWIRRTA